MQSPITSAVQLQGLACDVAGSCLEQMHPEELEAVTRFDAYSELIDFIRAHCHAGIRVVDMATIMHMGRESFSRKFSEGTGISPKRFFRRFLIRKACDLLQDPHVTIREVAFELQFSNECYFSRFFKNHTGQSPSHYQQRHRKP